MSWDTAFRKTGRFAEPASFHFWAAGCSRDEEIQLVNQLRKLDRQIDAFFIEDAGKGCELTLEMLKGNKGNAPLLCLKVKDSLSPGLALLRRMREEERLSQVPVIVLLPAGNPFMEAECQVLDAEFYVGDSIDCMAFGRILERALSWSPRAASKRRRNRDVPWALLASSNSRFRVVRFGAGAPPVVRTFQLHLPDVTMGSLFDKVARATMALCSSATARFLPLND